MTLVVRPTVVTTFATTGLTLTLTLTLAYTHTLSLCLHLLKSVLQLHSLSLSPSSSLL
jgi:hypothetical protein